MEVLDRQENAEFLIEGYLKKLDSNLHNCFKSSIFAIDRLLTNYKMVFPFYTDHTLEHSEQVIRYSNYFIGDKNVQKLNADELYVLLIGACLHDVGMGISKNDYEQFKDKVEGLQSYIEKNPNEEVGEYTRIFHQEFSALFIEKYKDLLEIPSDDYLFCICQIARGHRKHNLLNENEFQRRYMLKNGNIVRLPYLAAIVKIADEMDIANERNLLIDYDEYINGEDEVRNMCYKSHQAIKKIDFEENIRVCYNTSEDDVQKEIESIEQKVMQTFEEYKAVIEIYPEFEGVYKNIIFIRG